MNSSGKGKVALVTGAGTGTGIGTAVALALLREDYSVVLIGRRAEPLNEVVKGSGAGDRALAVPCDVGQPDAVRAAFDKVQQVFGRLDLLFNNAGVGAPPVPVEELTFEQWQNAVNINLTGSFLCAQQAIRLMKAQSPRGGRIINNGSISAHAPRPNSAPYTATRMPFGGRG